MAWQSPDGSGWSGSALEGQSGVKTDSVLYAGCAVAELSDGLLATLPTERGTLTWTSVDGTRWIAGETLDMLATAPQVAAVGNTVVVAGFESEPFLHEGSRVPVMMIGAANP
jgi:hypothetical protein